MAETKIALLPDRGVVTVTGPDAAKLLQGIITNDVALLDRATAIHGGLLSPQGKILFDFFVVKTADGFCLETARNSAQSLSERLRAYKLRANADIADASADYSVAAAWGGAYEPRGRGGQPICFVDPRLPELGYRELMTMRSDWALAGEAADSATADEYHAHRIALGVPEAGKDFVLGDTYPHEALYDQLNGVSFAKGCYVGQEVVSRMQHRATARKRIVQVAANAPLPEPGTPVLAGGAEIGRLGSTAGTTGLALIRLDRAAEAKSNGESLSAGDVAIELRLPAFARFPLDPGSGGAPA
jgi:folate-binding protein YgfZ